MLNNKFTDFMFVDGDGVTYTRNSDTVDSTQHNTPSK